MKIKLLFLAILILGIMACGQLPTPTPQPSLPTPTSLPTRPPEELWFLLRGDEKADQSWGVDVDSSGNVYWAPYEQEPGQLFTDMSIYKLSPDGEELWHTRWGREFQEKAFVVDVSGSRVYVGGLTHTAIGLTEADMAILALDADTGELEWDFTWGQGIGYEELDGLVVDGDHIYASGWTTSEETGHDIGVLKLDRQGRKIWESVWGTDGFDTGDGQLVLSEDSVYVSGRINGTTMLTGGQAVVARFSRETGEYIQHATWGRSFLADGLGMTGDGTHLYVVGINLTAGQGNRVFVLKYDKDLNLLWERLWGDPRGEHTGRAAGIDGSGNVLVAVNSRAAPTSPTDICLVKYSSAGEKLWESCWDGPDEELAQGLVIDGDFVYIAGTTKYVEQNQSDALLIKADALTGQFPAK